MLFALLSIALQAYAISGDNSGDDQVAHKVVQPEVLCQNADCSAISLSVKLGDDDSVAKFSLFKRTVVTENFRSRATHGDDVMLMNCS